MTAARLFLVAGAVLSGIAVAAGAFGAHGLRDRLTADLLAIFETAARYQMYHGLALLAVGLIMERVAAPQIMWTGWLFIAGTVIFSGSLYVLALSGVRAWGAVTPVGGALLLVGWACLAWGILRSG